MKKLDGKTSENLGKLRPGGKFYGPGDPESEIDPLESAIFEKKKQKNAENPDLIQFFRPDRLECLRYCIFICEMFGYTYKCIDAFISVCGM